MNLRFPKPLCLAGAILAAIVQIADAATVLNENFDTRTTGAVGAGFGNIGFTGGAHGFIGDTAGNKGFTTGNQGRYNLSIAASSTGTANPTGAATNVIATFSSPVEVGTANPTVVSLKIGSFGNNNSQSFKAVTVRGLSSTGLEVFEFWAGFGSATGSTKICARGAADTAYTNNPTESLCFPAGTSIYSGYSYPNSTSTSTNLLGLATLTITIANNVVSYSLSAGTPGATLTFPINSSATDITKLEFVNINNVTTQNAGYWLDDLLVTGTVAATPPPIYPVTWRALANSTWNTTSTNWVDAATGTTNNVYQDTEAVSFTDTAASTSVNVANTVLPGAITVNNTASNYTFSGTGSIGGGAGLTKTGNGSLTLALTNNAYGATTISAGRVNAGAPGSIGSGALTVNGTLDLAGFDVGVNGISGTGVVTNSGASGTNILIIGLGGGGSTFDGVIRDSSSGAITTLVKTNGGNIILNASQAWRGDTYARAGTLILGAANVLPTNTVLYVGGLNLGVNIVMNGFDQMLRGMVGAGSGGGNRRFYNGSVTAATLTFNSVAGETNGYNHTLGIAADANANNFSVVKNGPGQQRVGTCNYSGPTTVNNGGLLFTANALAATGTVTVNSSGTVGGSAQVGGFVNVVAGGTLAPGITGINNLEVTNGAALAGSAVFELNATSSDRLVSTNGAAITLGGTLSVENLSAGSLTNGTIYKLLDGTLAGSFSSITVPGGAAHWNTSQLTAGGDGTLTFINNAPSASNFTAGVAVGGTVQLSVVGKHASDADVGDTTTITAVSMPANGTASILGGTNILYTSTAAANDSFTYTVSDGLSSTTATVTVETYPPTGFNLISGPTPVGGGEYMFNYLGIPGQQYAIEEAASLTPPITWTPVVTNTATGNGSLSFTITPANPSGFFRTRSLP